MPNVPLKNGLFVRRFWSNKLLLFLNFLYSFKRKKQVPSISPKKILLCNIANFGDVVISTTVLPTLKSHFPNCEIGFLAATAVGKTVLEHIPWIARVHCIDHWVFRCHSEGFCKAVLHYIIQARKLRKELKACQYDTAIDLYSYFPNAIPLLAKSRIPIRIGFPTGGFSNLLTHSVSWTFADRYVGYAHLHLLKVLGIDPSHENPLPAYNFKKNRSQHVIIHMGCSHALKQWKTDRWIQLILRLEKLGWKIVLTGKGGNEKKICDLVSAQTSATNLCNQLSWPAFVSTIQEARLVITVDSVAVHTAAGSLTPTLVIFSGINSANMWTPPCVSCKTLVNTIPCYPCFNRKGCSTMKCINEISVDDVFLEAVKLLH